MKKCYWSRLRVLTWAVLFAAGSVASCSDDDKKDDPTPPPPPVELKDQIEYDGGKLIDIKSAIFDVEDTDLYTFFLSPTVGIQDVAGMQAANDFLRVVVRNPKGTVDIQTETFEIAYKDISVKMQTMSDVKTVKLSADLIKEVQRLNLRVEVELQSGKKLLARYNNFCTEALPQKLQNQFELDKEAKAIGSVLAWYSPKEGATTWSFYTASGVTAPSAETPADMQITVADGVETASLDLSTVDAEKVKIICGEFQSAAGTTGTLALDKKEDGTMTLTLDAKTESSRLRAVYGGAFTAGTDTRNNLKITLGETPDEVALTRVFHNVKSLKNYYAFGLYDAQAPADLMQGKYAAMLGASDLNFGQTVEVEREPSKFSFVVYDYQTYTTWDISKGATGTITVAGTPEHPYFQIAVAFPEGPAIEAEWYGDATAAAEEFNLVPVKPFEPLVVVVNEAGEEQLHKKIESMEVRLEKNYRLRGGDPQYGGATFDAYFFYFRLEGADGIEDVYTVPCLMIPANYLNSTDLNLADPKEDLYWNFKYAAENKLQYGMNGYSETYTMYGMTSGYCPNEVKVTAIKNEDKTWNVSFSMKDEGTGSFGSSWGYKTTITIDWKGVATKYTGSKKNDLTDADY